MARESVASIYSFSAPDLRSGGHEFKSHIAVVHLEPLDGELAVASHWVVMSLFTIIGLVGVVVVVALIIFGPRGGTGGD